MSLDVQDFGRMMPDAVRAFWHSRSAAMQKQEDHGGSDVGNRGAVTAGKNLDGFATMLEKVIIRNGIPNPAVFRKKGVQLVLPGFFRATKEWDFLVVSDGKLVAAIELKSIASSFGNNMNNRAEEAIGNAVDFRTAFKNGAFGDSLKPFVGYFFVMVECAKSTKPVKVNSKHFPALPEFQAASYVERGELLCRKLVLEQLYDAASLVLIRQESEVDGKYRAYSDLTSPHRFVEQLAGAVAITASGTSGKISLNF